MRRTLTLSILVLFAVGAAITALRWSSDSSPGDGSSGPSNPVADLMLAPEELRFGEVPIGELNSESMIVTNLGDQPMTFEEISTTAPFRVAGQGFTLEPGASKEISVQFGSHEPGEFEGIDLELRSRELGLARVPLSARIEVPQQVVVKPDYIEFGEVAVGQIASAMIRISNPGKKQLHISGLGAIAPFGAGSYPSAIKPGEEIVVDVYYSPETVGKARGSFRIRSDDPSWPSFNVSLKGVGSPQEPDPRLVTSNGALEFGEVAVGDVRTLWMAVMNRGYSPLTIRTVTTEQPFQAPSKSKRIHSGGVHRFRVQFAPKEAGPVLKALMIHSNDPEAEPIIVSLVGQGGSAGSTDYASHSAEDFPYSTGPRASAPGSKGAGGGDSSDTDHLPPWAFEDNSGTPVAQLDADGNPVEESSDPEEAFGVGRVDPDSKVAVGARLATMGEGGGVDSVELTPEGDLIIEGLELPNIEMGFGKGYAFQRVEGPIRSYRAADGSMVLDFTVVLARSSGSEVEVPITATTGTAPPIPDQRPEPLIGEVNGCNHTFVAQTKVPAELEWTDTVVAMQLGFQACP